MKDYMYIHEATLFYCMYNVPPKQHLPVWFEYTHELSTVDKMTALPAGPTHIRGLPVRKL